MTTQEQTKAQEKAEKLAFRLLKKGHSLGQVEAEINNYYGENLTNSDVSEIIELCVELRDFL